MVFEVAQKVLAELTPKQPILQLAGNLTVHSSKMMTLIEHVFIA